MVWFKKQKSVEDLDDTSRSSWFARHFKKQKSPSFHTSPNFNTSASSLPSRRPSLKSAKSSKTTKSYKSTKSTKSGKNKKSKKQKVTFNVEPVEISSSSNPSDDISEEIVEREPEHTISRCTSAQEISEQLMPDNENRSILNFTDLFKAMDNIVNDSDKIVLERDVMEKPITSPILYFNANRYSQSSLIAVRNPEGLAEKFFNGSVTSIDFRDYILWLGGDDLKQSTVCQYYMDSFPWYRFDLLDSLHMLCKNLFIDLSNPSIETERVLRAFSHSWTKTNQRHLFGRADVAYTVAFSLLILNYKFCDPKQHSISKKRFVKGVTDMILKSETQPAVLKHEGNRRHSLAPVDGDIDVDDFAYIMKVFSKKAIRHSNVNSKVSDKSGSRRNSWLGRISFDNGSKSNISRSASTRIFSKNANTQENSKLNMRNQIANGSGNVARFSTESEFEELGLNLDLDQTPQLSISNDEKTPNGTPSTQNTSLNRNSYLHESETETEDPETPHVLPRTRSRSRSRSISYSSRSSNTSSASQIRQQSLSTAEQSNRIHSVVNAAIQSMNITNENNSFNQEQDSDPLIIDITWIKKVEKVLEIYYDNVKKYRFEKARTTSQFRVI